ncbi:spore germination protein [Cytobacillus kochii]|uniref:spore germination protein n=1 Tax=Cytobacillus kochii TaxID=859143 RepID=UPI003851353B
MHKNNTSNEIYIIELFRHSSDISVERHHLFSQINKEQMLVFYCNGLIDHKLLINSILPDIQSNYYQNGLEGVENINSSMRLSWKENKDNINQNIQEKILNGYTGISIADTVYFFNTANPPIRKTEESTTEVNIRGPRDAFVEDISSNMALVRKRVKSNSLVSKSFTIGQRSQTQVQLIYLTDIQNDEIIHEVTNRLNAIDIDFLNSDNQLLGLIGESNYSPFPLLQSVSRPDGVVSSLARGRFAILVDNVPNALIAPANLGLLLHTSEDEHSPYYYVTFELMLRLIGLILSIFLPAFWVSISAFNMDQIPLPLLATIAASRIGIPFNTTLELLLMLGLFELFREAGVRLPKAVGQTVAVVGGLVVGDAAIRAGLTSPTMLVISSITAVSTFTLGNQALFGTVSLLRIGSIILSSVFGMFGFFISVFLVLGHLAKLESFGIPYLSPVSPFVKKDFLKSITKYPTSKQNERAKILNPLDKDRQGDK